MSQPPTQRPRSIKPLLEHYLELGLFRSRWLMAPFYVGLVVALGALLIVFTNEAIHELWNVMTMSAEEAILMVLALIDLSLAGNLLLIV
ncbi:MAG: YqhA family protein, partial [Phenylobacterium sp.]|nr:YqhA family protein [Phenylobacterium sp.]